MQLIRGINNLPTYRDGTVVTIGNFDGVHRGHQAIFEQVTAEAKQRGLQSVVMTFQPLPHDFFQPGAVRRLSTLRDKVTAIEACGIDTLLFVRFNRQLADMPAETFIQDHLAKQLQVRHLIVGDDFRFGKARAGDFAMLQRSGKQHGFSVNNTPTVSLAATSGSASSGSSNDPSNDAVNQRISSSAVRTALSNNDCELAARYLGSLYQITGSVVRGQQLGRTIGFPTANICLKNLVPAPHGVFAVTATRCGDPTAKPLHGVANLGERPTVDGKRLLLEVNILDANPDLYGEKLSVRFHKHLRGERKFNSLDELKQAIAKDADNVRGFFKLNTPARH